MGRGGKHSFACHDENDEKRKQEEKKNRTQMKTEKIYDKNKNINDNARQ